MRRLLVVSPHFPPINAPDMHRVRLSLRYFRDFGWDPAVLAVAPAYLEALIEPLLIQSIPTDVPVHRVSALPLRWTRKAGIGAIAVRAFYSMYREGFRMIRRYKPDLVYISTTAFQAMALGRMWKARTGVPFVLDMQDPWVPESDQVYVRRRGLKHYLAARSHRILEPWTMREVAGLVAVSDCYMHALRRRYPWISEDRCLTLPFGADARDHDIARAAASAAGWLQPRANTIHGVYAGALSPSMLYACEAICAAFRSGLERRADLYGRVQLHFIGTAYAHGETAESMVRPLAARFGLNGHIREHAARVPYFAALHLQQQADFLLVPGSMDPAYTASKIVSTIRARRPLLAVFHEASSVVHIVRETGAGEIVTFVASDGVDALSERLLAAWTPLLEKLPFTPNVNPEALESYSAREATSRQCTFFDRLLEASGVR